VNTRSRGGGATIPILGGVDIRSTLSSHGHSTYPHPKKFFQFSPPTKILQIQKLQLPLGGEGGGYNKILFIMIYFSINRLTDFSLGIHYKSRRMYNHSVYSLSISVIIFTLTFVITKYNS
jgi:hypothetical protein